MVTLLGLQSVEGIYLNAATVKATLRDSKEMPIPAFANVSMPYIPGSDGAYYWWVQGAVMMLPKHVEYSLEIKAEQSGLKYRVVHVVSVIDGDV